MYVRNSHISLIIVIFGENPCEEEEDELERVEKSFKEIEHPNHEMIQGKTGPLLLVGGPGILFWITHPPRYS